MPPSHSRINKRIDVVLAEKGLSRSRSHSQDLIRQGQVMVNGQPCRKVSLLVGENDDIQVKQSPVTNMVSRGGVKLLRALKDLEISVEAKRCLDIGVSTGGFSQVLLEGGARSVVGVDVGTNQIHASLRTNQRFQGYEQFHFLKEDLTQLTKEEGLFDVVVCDVSFVSIEKVIARTHEVLSPQGEALYLVKPQFEVGRQNISKSGLVSDPSLYQDVESKIRRCVKAANYDVLEYINSRLEGKDGNKEFFVHFRSIT